MFDYLFDYLLRFIFFYEVGYLFLLNGDWTLENDNLELFDEGLGGDVIRLIPLGNPELLLYIELLLFIPCWIIVLLAYKLDPNCYIFY